MTKTLEEIAADYDWTAERLLAHIEDWARENDCYIQLILYLIKQGNSDEPL